MFQQKQEPQPSQVRSPQIGQKSRFRISLVIVIILCILFSVAFITVIIILSNQGIVTSSGLFISIIVPVLVLVISLIQLFQFFAPQRAMSLEKFLHTLVFELDCTVPTGRSLESAF